MKIIHSRTPSAKADRANGSAINRSRNRDISDACPDLAATRAARIGTTAIPVAKQPATTNPDPSQATAVTLQITTDGTTIKRVTSAVDTRMALKATGGTSTSSETSSVTSSA